MTASVTRIGHVFLAAFLLLAAGIGPAAAAAPRLKPFNLAYTAMGDLPSVVAHVEKKLSDHGFSIVGSFAPYTGATFPGGEVVSAQIIGVTSPALQQAAAETTFGGYAVVQRVTVTRVTSHGTTRIQVA